MIGRPYPITDAKVKPFAPGRDRNGGNWVEALLERVRFGQGKIVSLESE
jgi:hypothetical protein